MTPLVRRLGAIMDGLISDNGRMVPRQSNITSADVYASNRNLDDSTRGNCQRSSSDDSDLGPACDVDGNGCIDIACGGDNCEAIRAIWMAMVVLI